MNIQKRIYQLVFIDLIPAIILEKIEAMRIEIRIKN